MSFGDGIGNLKQALGPLEPPSEVQALRRPETAHTQLGASATPQTDEASLSSASGLVAKALEGSDVRVDKVEALRQAIAAGTYKVSSSDVAEKIIQSLTK